MELFFAQASDAGTRLDHFLAARLPAFSRARLQSWIDEQLVTANGVPRKSSYKLREGDRIEVEPADLKPLRAFAEEIPLEVLYEDAAIIAINKPAGLVVHAGAGSHSGTLVNALLHRFEKLSTVGGDLRPGIVHRLDKGTSGVLLAARTDAAHRNLAAQFASRKVVKVYLAMVQGRVGPETGFIRSAIGRDPVRRTRMAANAPHGRDAHTQFRVLQRFERFTSLEVRIGTGRTHQIRVHLASIGHPVACDSLYGASAKPEGLPPLGRPWLHSWRITFVSPDSGQEVTVEAPLAAELEGWKNNLL